MGVPFIKLYELPPGYTQDADTDIQSQTNDELVPVVLKLGQLSDVKATTPLVGAVLSNQQPLICFDLAGGTHTENIVSHPSKVGISIPQTTAWASVLCEPVGALGAVIKDSGSNVIPASGYTFTVDGIKFTGSTVGTTIQFYKKAAIGSSNTFAFLGDTFYRGANPAWNRILVSKNGGTYAVQGGVVDGVGYINMSGVTTGLNATYAVTTPYAKQFISPDPNWIGSHWNMWPDVFVGITNYPGDSYTDVGGTTYTITQMPLFRGPGTYSVNFRDGTINFPDYIDSVANPVRANYAHLTGVANVTGQVLDPVAGTGNTVFKASSETLFPDSHGKQWLARNSAYMPTNIYVAGVATPQEKQVVPYDQLDVLR